MPACDIGKAQKGLEYFGKQIMEGFVIDEGNFRVVQMLIMYFTSDPEFTKMGKNYSLNKGILLTGPVGTGKTILMKVFDSWLHNVGFTDREFVITSTRTVERDFTEKGNEIIDYYGKGSYKSDFTARVYCFDDLGLESSSSKHFGNGYNVMAEVIMDRYDLRLLTHATTNLVPEDFREIYGERILSRMYEMFNCVVIDGKDRRKI